MIVLSSRKCNVWINNTQSAHNKDHNFATELKTLKESQVSVEKQLSDLVATITLRYNALQNVQKLKLSKVRLSKCQKLKFSDINFDY